MHINLSPKLKENLLGPMCPSKLRNRKLHSHPQSNNCGGEPDDEDLEFGRPHNNPKITP